MTNENKNKRYYWIKLKDTFFTSDTVDFLMSQKNGANYVVLYQMLCLKSVNTQGELSRKIGEMIIPFDVDKIHRDCKYFDIDTIRVALELYIRLGLIYEQDNGILQIANFDNMVGSETQGAVEKRQQRYQKKLEESRGIDNGIDRVYQYNRDKILDIRDKRIDNRDKIEEEKVSYDTQKKKTHKTFVKPTLEEVEAYCKERNNGIDAQHFIDFYESKDWFIGKNKMKDWRACIRTWERHNANASKNRPTASPDSDEAQRELHEDLKRYGLI